MKVEVGISNRHIHIKKEDYLKIFSGLDELTKVKALNQKGEYATNKKVTIKTSKGELTNVRVLIPFREYTQVEISRTDSYKLGIKPPIRNSGELEKAESVTIIGEIGKIEREACIIAARHLHINNDDYKKYGLEGKGKVRVKTFGEKSAILDNVFIKLSPNAYTELHLDTDDANALCLENGDIVEIIKEWVYE